MSRKKRTYCLVQTLEKYGQLLAPFKHFKCRPVLPAVHHIAGKADHRRLIRVISRDCIERGRTAEAVIDRYQRVLKPMHQLHIEPTKKFANIIIPEGGNNEVAINLITDYIKGRLTTNKNK